MTLSSVSNATPLAIDYDSNGTTDLSLISEQQFDVMATWKQAQSLVYKLKMPATITNVYIFKLNAVCDAYTKKSYAIALEHVNGLLKMTGEQRSLGRITAAQFEVLQNIFMVLKLAIAEKI